MTAQVVTLPGQALAPINEAVRLLAEARELGDFTHLYNMAMAVEEYAHAERLGDEAERYAREIRIRAARKAGALLKEMAQNGERVAKTDTRKANAKRHGLVADETVTLTDLGVSHDRSSRWQKLAVVPDDIFEKAVSLGKGETTIIREQQAPRDLRPVRSERGKGGRGGRRGPTQKQSLNGLQQAAVAVQSLAEGLEGEFYGDWSQLYDIAEAQPYFEILAESQPRVSARIKRVLRDRRAR